MNIAVPRCPDALPTDLREKAIALAEAWIRSDVRPQPKAETLVHWDQLINEWSECHGVPIYVRRVRGNRGSVITHESGRDLIPVDNSTANWVYVLALASPRPTLDDVTKMIGGDQMPIAMAFSREERLRAKYPCPRRRVELNSAGWKLCQIDNVGFRRRIELTTHSIESLTDHFRRFLAPSNMVLVPKAWSGLGEMPEMIEAARRWRKERG